MLITSLVLVAVTVYALATFVTSLHLHLDRGMGTGHAWLGGIIWPFVAYRAIRNGWATGFWRKFNKATTRN